MRKIMLIAAPFGLFAVTPVATSAAMVQCAQPTNCSGDECTRAYAAYNQCLEAQRNRQDGNSGERSSPDRRNPRNSPNINNDGRGATPA